MVQHTASSLALNPVAGGLTHDFTYWLDQVSWYGRGFQETYCDRKTGAKIGRYEAKVAELETPYMRPQENGNRVDVRSVEIRREDGSGLCFKALQARCSNSVRTITAWKRWRRRATSTSWCGRGIPTYIWTHASAGSAAICPVWHACASPIFCMAACPIASVLPFLH